MAVLISLLCIFLGDEQCSASGQSIKKAQHAAELALKKTDFHLPEP